MKNNEKISIVVPIYNVEEYLPRCLDSIIAQTYTNIEILLVDDGSPDNAGAICDEYATKDSRIRVFHIPNGGVAKARQLGVESSTGDYIVFVDPDDWLPLDSVEVLYSNMTDDVDLVIGGYTKFKMRNKLTFNTYRHNTISNKTYIEDVIKKRVVPTPWGRIYRQSLFSSNSFPRVRRSQDFLMNYELSNRIRAVKFIENSVYNYFEREDSAMKKHKFSITKTDDSFIIEAFKIYDINNMRLEYKGSVSILILTELFSQGHSEVNINEPIIKRLYEELGGVKLPFKYRILKNTVCRPYLFSIVMLFKAIYSKCSFIKGIINK